jgi:hypothetical protein
VPAADLDELHQRDTKNRVTGTTSRVNLGVALKREIEGHRVRPAAMAPRWHAPRGIAKMLDALGWRRELDLFARHTEERR